MPYCGGSAGACNSIQAEYLRANGDRMAVEHLPDHSPYVLYSMVGSGHEASGIPTGYMNHAIASFIEHYVVRGEKAAMNVEESFADGTSGNSMPFYIKNLNPSPREELAKAIKAMWPEYAEQL